MTNYEKIVSMSKKELADFICTFISAFDCEEGYCPMFNSCAKGGKSSDWMDEEFDKEDIIWNDR